MDATIAVMLMLGLAEVLVLVGGTLHSMVPGEAPREATVVIEDGRIREIMAPGAVPDGARTVDASGLHLFPGLIDAFAYFDPEQDPLHTAAGVTLYCDHGNNIARIFDARSAIEGARAAGPALRIAGAVVDGFPPSTSEALVVRDAKEAAAVVNTLAQEGVDFVAFQSAIAEEPWRALIAAAHEKKLAVWGPLPRGLALDAALSAKQDGLLFLDALLPAGTTWDKVGLEAFDATAKRLAEAGTRIVPALGSNTRLFTDQGDGAGELKWLAPTFVAQWRAELKIRRGFLTPDFLEKTGRATKTQRELVAKLHAAGVVLLPGSGAPHPWLLPGAALHDELDAWVAAGIPRADVLRLATRGAAEALGIAGQRGSLEAGAVADIIGVRGDPIADGAGGAGWSALRAPELVVLRGHPLTRADLDGMLRTLEEHQKAAQEAAAKPIVVGEPAKPDGEVVLSGYAETSALGVRTAAERWAVVRTAKDTFAICGRRVMPQPSGSSIEIELRQTVRDRTLDGFEITLRTQKHELSVKGFWTANQWRVERRADGLFVDIQVARDPVAAVDVGSVTTLMLIALTQEGGPFPVIHFHEALELEVVRWELTVEPDGAHLLRTPDGGKYALFDVNGALLRASEREGSGTSDTLCAPNAIGPGGGLPLSEKKRALLAPKPAADKPPDKR